jgi:hypothetical protein
MAIIFQTRDDILEMILRGSITAEDLMQLLQKMADFESSLEVAPDRITDMMDANASELLSSDLVTFAKSRNFAKLKNKVKSAIIATTPLQHGLARMFMAYNQNPDIEIMIFKDSASAYSWIKPKANVSINGMPDHSTEQTPQDMVNPP